MDENMTYSEYLKNVKSGIMTKNGNCPVTPLLLMLRGKWKSQILYELCIHDAVRFGVLKKELDGITATMLTSSGPVMTGREAPSVLVLGNGTGTYAKQCLRYFPGSTAEGVEIDGKITALAGAYFAMPEEVAVTEYDGRAFLQAVDTKYDVILVDAYQDITIPFQMSSTEFFTMAREHLTEGGVMVVNMNMHSDGEGSINEYLCDTIASVFPYVSTVDVRGSTNRELFASLDAEPAALLAGGLEKVSDPALYALMGSVAERLTPCEGGGHILTDDRAPVEVLGMRMIDSLIQDELGYYKGVYEREGLQGILDDFGIR